MQSLSERAGRDLRRNAACTAAVRGAACGTLTTISTQLEPRDKLRNHARVTIA